MNKVTAADITLESHVALASRQFLQLNGWAVHRIQADRHGKGGNRKAHEREEPGTPDFIVFKQRRCSLVMRPYDVFYLETKRTVGGVIRKSQKDWAVAHSDDLVCYARSFEELRGFVRREFPWVENKIHG